MDHSGAMEDFSCLLAMLVQQNWHFLWSGHHVFFLGLFRVSGYVRILVCRVLLPLTSYFCMSCRFEQCFFDRLVSWDLWQFFSFLWLWYHLFFDPMEDFIKSSFSSSSFYHLPFLTLRSSTLCILRFHELYYHRNMFGFVFRLWAWGVFNHSRLVLSNALSL